MNKFLFHSKAKFGLLLIFKLIYAAGFVGFALLLQFLINFVMEPSTTPLAFTYAMLITLGYMGVAITVLLLKDALSVKYVNQGVKLLRDELANKLLNSTYQDFSKNDSSQYLSNLTNDIKLIATNYFNSVLSLPDEIFTFILAVIAAFIVNYVIAIAMLCLTLLIIVVPLIFNKPMNKANNKLSEDLQQYTHILKETFLGIDIVKSFNASVSMSSTISEINSKLAKSNTKAEKLNLFAQDCGMLIVVLLQIGTIAVSGLMVIYGYVEIGAIIAAVQLGNNLFMPIMQVAGKSALIGGIKELNSTILQIVNVQLENETEKVSFSNKIIINNLNYKFDGDNKNTLTNINLEFEKNKKYLLIGKSGSGKSTLLKILAKLFKDYQGNISMDNIDFKNITENQLYQNISLAGQKSYLFDRTIKNNIDFNQTADEEMLAFAIKNAELQSFINAQPNGIDEQINEEVNQISGGEKLRIGLARALYRNNELLLLDEVTSALDKDTAHKVEQNILSFDNKTIISVSHKIHLDLIDKYDKICILENGNILEFDSPQQIINTKTFRKYIATENQ